MTMVWTYGLYLAISIVLTIWVAHTLRKNGAIFLSDTFKGNELLANSVSQLLVVGFYLINIGYVCLTLKYGGEVSTAREVMEYLSVKLGIVLVVLGVLHLINLLVFASLRGRQHSLENSSNSPRKYRLPPEEIPVRPIYPPR